MAPCGNLSGRTWLQYAIVGGKRVEAYLGGRGTCPTCGADMVAKCGPRVIHHWAHAGRRNCDPWWENETEWHRHWKNRFPEECREVSHTAPDGEIHRADIKTPTGIIIEVQHSAITDAERLARESFYGNLVWIIDGRSFRRNFDIYHQLPHPKSELAKDLVWSKAKRGMHGSNGGMFFRLSEALKDNPTVTKSTLRGGWIHDIREIEQEMLNNSSDYYQYDWVRPRQTWLEARCPVFIDLGDECLVRLETYDESGLRCVRLVSKKKFIHDAFVEDQARLIASRFYLIEK